jgi:hypothetical protein
VDGFYEFVKDKWKQYLLDGEDTDSTKNRYATLDEMDGFAESDQTVWTAHSPPR